MSGTSFNPLRLLRTRPEMMLRLALVPIIWGLALSCWFSLGRAVLSRSLPPVEAQVERQAAIFSNRLQDLAARNSTLVNDSRISAATDEAADTARRRALYEFSYLQNTRDVYVYDPAGNRIWNPLNAREMPVAPDSLKETVGRNGTGVRPLTLSQNMTLLLLVQRHAHGDTLIASLFPWARLNMESILMPSGSPLVLFYNHGNTWLELDMAQGTAHSIGKPDLNIDREMLGLAPAVTAAIRVPGWDGWWVAGTLNVMKESKTVFTLQLATLAAALGMTLLLIWKPWGGALTAGTAHAFMGGDRRRGKGGGSGGGWGIFSKKIGDTGTFYHGGGFQGSQRREDGEPALHGLGTSSMSDIARKQEKQRQRDSVYFTSMVQKIRGAMLAPNGVHGLYQPVFRASDGMAVINEVLLRLSIPNDEDMTPNDFLAVAKKADLLPALDATLLKNVIARNFKNGPPKTKLALNISSTTFDHMTYMREIITATNPTVMEHLVFEVRSRELIGDKGAMGFLFDLKDMGAQLSVDYFGGVPMLEMSKRMGFDHVKINALDMWDDLDKRRELVGLAKTAARIGVPLVLEKVETLQMEVFARRIGIPYLQGYHFAKPAAEPVTGQMVAWREMARDAATEVDRHEAADPSDETTE